MERKGPQGSEEPVLNIAGERVALGPLRADLLPLYGRGAVSATLALLLHSYLLSAEGLARRST